METTFCTEHTVRLPELAATLDAIGKPKVLVVGDLMLDRYSWGDAERISPEAPVIVLRSDHEEDRLGGAAVVAHFLQALGAKVACAGVVGTDFAGETMRRLLSDAGVRQEFIVSEQSRPSTIKERFVGKISGRHAHQILRVDREVRGSISRHVEQQILSMVLPVLRAYDALLISDYGKGVCTPDLCRQLISATRLLGIPVLIDPPLSADYRRYFGATAITPNRREAALATASPTDTPQAAIQAGQILCRDLDLQISVVKLDRDGIAYVNREGDGGVFSADERSVYDVTGAGDMVLAVLGLAFAAGVAPALAVQLANHAAGLEVERFGATPIMRDELLSNLTRGARSLRQSVVSSNEIAAIIASHRLNHKRIVFANGCFDVLHAGHVQYLSEASQLGDVLIVGINSDQSVRRLKGPHRPILPEASRVAMLAALRGVDHVIVFQEDTPQELLRLIRPDVLVKGGTYALDEVVGREFVASYGGRVCVTSRVEGMSTTRLLERLRNQDAEYRSEVVPVNPVPAFR